MSHENLQRDLEVTPSSNRSFGLVFFAVFTLVGLFPLLKHAPVRWWALGVAAVFLVVSLVRPQLLTHLNRWWTRLGLLLGSIVSPISLGVLFYGVLTPIGLLVRLFGSDPLRLKWAPNQPSYWVDRQPPGPPPDSMNNQF